MIAIREAVQAIEELPFVRASSSLYSMRNVQNVDGFIHTGPYLGEIPSELKSIEAIKQETLRNPLVRGNLLSDDATAMAINISLKRQASRPGFDKEVTLSIEQAIAPLRSQIQDVFQIGGSSIRDALTARILHDQLLVLPLSLMVLVITLRSVNGALLPLLTAGLSVVWTLGLMALLQIPLNVMTSIIPALLIIIGSTEDIHLFAEYQSGIGRGMVRVEAIEHMATTMGTAVLLTFVTTYLGFLSISLNNIELLYQFGVMASSGLLLNFLITVFLHPIYLRYFGQCPADSSLGSSANVYAQLAVFVHRAVSTNKQLTFGLIVMLILVSGYGTLSLKVNNNPMDYFAKESIIQQHADTLHRHLSGVHTFSIIIDSGIDETFLQVKYLAEIQKLQTYLSHTGMFDRSFSFADFVSLVHGIMNDGEKDAALLPESDDIVREYMLFIKHRDVRDYISAQYNRARIIVRHNIGSSYDLNQAVEQIRDYANKHLDTGLRVEITGEAVLANQAADSMAHAQAQSLILMALSIFLIVSLLFVNIRAGLIAVTPILIPIVALFGVMDFAGIPLDSGTSMVAAIAMGVCVDDTMHFMSRYHHRLQARKDGTKALRDTVRAEAIPIISTSLALAAGFATLALSSFLPVVYLGLLSAMVICLALMATFLLTPLLLGTTQQITAWDLLSVKLRRECITRCALFRGMAIWQIKKILLVINVQEYQTGQLIIAQGELGRDVFVILEGEVEIRKRRTDGTAVRLKTLGIGEI